MILSSNSHESSNYAIIYWQQNLETLNKFHNQTKKETQFCVSLLHFIKTLHLFPWIVKLFSSQGFLYNKKAAVNLITCYCLSTVCQSKYHNTLY